MQHRISTAAAMLAMFGAVASPAQTAQRPVPVRALEGDTERAATTCRSASTARARADGRVAASEVADATWFLIESARSSPAKGPILSQIGALAGRSPPDARTVSDNAAALLRQCAARWPRSVRGATPIRLPIDPFDRELLCSAVSSLLYGAAQTEQTAYGSSAMLAPLKTISDRGNRTLTSPELAKRGLTSPGQLAVAYSRGLGQAVQLGNLNDVVRACA